MNKKNELKKPGLFTQQVVLPYLLILHFQDNTKFSVTRLSTGNGIMVRVSITKGKNACAKTWDEEDDNTANELIEFANKEAELDTEIIKEYYQRMCALPR